MLEEQTAKLVEWIESHNKNKDGGYYSNANHPIWGVINENQLPHAFQYYGIILGYLNLYRQLGNEKYLEKAKRAGDFLSLLQTRSGEYRYDKFEFDTGKNKGFTLIHNVLPSIPLIYLSKETKNEKYFLTAKKNIMWAFSRLWSGECLSGCVNQDVCASEALATLAIFDDNPVYIKRAKKVADWCLKFQINQGELKGGFIRGLDESNLVIPWYDGLTALSYFNLYELTGEEKYLLSAKNTAKFLRKNLTEEGLIHWYLKRGKEWVKIEKPILISPTGLLLYFFDKIGVNYETEILNSQIQNGAFPSASGYDDFRDKMPVLGWNQFMFLYLSSKVGEELPEIKSGLLEIKNPKSEVKTESYKRIIRGLVKSFGKSIGYVDLIKDGIVKSSQEIKDGHFEFYGEKDSYDLRVREDRSIWRTTKIDSETEFVKVYVLNNTFFAPYFLFERFFTRILMLNFSNEKVFKLAKIRKIKRLIKR